MGDIIKKYNNICYRTIKIKKKKHIITLIKNCYKDPEFKADDKVRISKYKDRFANYCLLNWFKEMFSFKKVKNTVPWIYLIEDFNGQEIIKSFYEGESQKRN